jgi:adenylate kinase family enzyme
MSGQEIKVKIFNAIILGPSSSGKTSVAKFLAEKYNGQRISLDGLTSSGRPINSIVSINKAAQFTDEEIGVLVRRLMIKEAKHVSKNRIPWFIDDIDNYIYDILPKSLHDSTRVIVIIPTIDRIVKNVLQRNKEAVVASEERHIIYVLRQLKNFVTPFLMKSSEAKKMMDEKKHYAITNKEIMDACEYDKMYYSIAEKKSWEDDTNDILAKYGFKSMKSKKIQYVELRPVNVGQHAVFLNNSSLSSLIRKIESVISIGYNE